MSSEAARTTYRYVVQTKDIEDSWWSDQTGPGHVTAEKAFATIDGMRKTKTRVYRVIKRTVTEEIIERGKQAWMTQR